MEVADADIQKQLAKSYTILFRAGRQDMTTRAEVFSDVLLDRQRSKLAGMVEYGYKQSGLLEIKRFWFIKYNKPVYYQPKEAHEIIRKAKNIIVPRSQKPSFMKDLTDLLKRLNTPKPRIIPVCESCVRGDRLTVLTRRNAVKVSETEVSCTTCARTDLRTDLKNMGVNLSRIIVQHLERQLSSVKSVPRLLEVLSPNFDPARETDLTLFDQIPAEELGKGKKIDSLPIPAELTKVLLSEGLERLLPVLR